MSSPSRPSPRQQSILGVSLDGGTSRPTTSGADVPEQDPDSPGRRRATERQLQVSDRIASRYAPNVREAEAGRMMNYVPLDQQALVLPDERDVAKTMKGDLDIVLTRMGSDQSKNQGWDKLLGTEGFQKQLQFLCSHSRTGHFIEQYGADGMYEGEFLYGMRHGKGSHEFRGEVYEGDWKWDNRHGCGTLQLADGYQIKGEWQGGKPHGYISMIDSKGLTVYEGEFKDGKRHGLGRQVFESGDMYDGGWQDGRLHDRGVYYFTNGDKLYGMWKNGLYDGIGVFHYADGSISRRVYRDGLLMSVQDYEHSSQRFGKTITREGMQMNTQDKNFPKDVFLLNSV